jgi:hypothetical protein
MRSIVQRTASARFAAMPAVISVSRVSSCAAPSRAVTGVVSPGRSLPGRRACPPDVNDPVGSLLQVVLRYEAAPDQDATANAQKGPWRRVRYFFQEPSVRMAVCAALDRASQRIAPLMMTGGRLTGTQARVAANALVFGYFGALEQWYLDGGVHPIAQYVEEGL